MDYRNGPDNAIFCVRLAEGVTRALHGNSRSSCYCSHGRVDNNIHIKRVYQYDIDKFIHSLMRTLDHRDAYILWECGIPADFDLSVAIQHIQCVMKKR